MSDSLMAMAKELVAELIRTQHLSSDEALVELQRTHETLLQLQRLEAGGEAAPPVAQPAAPAKDWRASIKKHTVVCLECGSTFRQLSARHLRLHDLDPRSYRQKHGIPSTQPLSSRETTARRRKQAQSIRPWEARTPARRKAAKKVAKE